MNVQAQDLVARARRGKGPFFMLLNFAIGGNAVGDHDANTVFPQTFDVEAYEGGIVGFSLTEEPAEVEAEAEAPAKKAPAKKTGGRRKARAAS